MLSTRRPSVAAAPYLALLLVGVITTGAAALQDVSPPLETGEERVEHPKASFVLNIARFTEWPAERFDDTHIEDELEPRLAPIVIGIVGEDAPFESSMRRLVREERIRGRAVHVRHIPVPPPPDTRDADPEATEEFHRRLRETHLLYITRDDRRRLFLREILQPVQNAAVLTVSDLYRFAESGGMVGLVMRENRLVIDANLKAIEQGGLTVGSRLLRLARIIDPDHP